MPTLEFWSRRLARAATFAAILFACGRLARAQSSVYSTTFNDFTPGLTLSGQPQNMTPNWDTNDAYTGGQTVDNRLIGQSDYVGTIGAYSNPNSDYLGALGGLQKSSVVPGASTVYLFRTFSLGKPFSYAFNVDFAIPESSPGLANDRFSWSFRASGVTLFSVNFVPESATNTAASGVQIPFGLHYTVGGPGTGIAATETATGNGILSSSVYHLAVNVNVPSKSFTISLTPPDATQTSYTSGAISLGNLDPSTVTDIAATWQLTDTSNTSNGGYQNAGTNALIFNNYMVTVPEPSTRAITGGAVLGLAAFVARRRLTA